LEDFVEINLKNNPICIHQHLKDEIVQCMPNIERINGEEIRASGWKYTQQTKEIQKGIDLITKDIGDSNEGNQYINDIENDTSVQDIIR
jgi:hypothetical protein